ncbi:MAG: PspC domain-containing protein [Chloroflexota bacterium]
MQNRLYRSRTDVMVAGVCGGLGKYLGIDSTLVRLFFVLLTLGSGAGVLIYLLLWLVVPREGAPAETAGDAVRSGVEEIGERARTLGTELQQGLRGGNPRAAVLIGGALVLLGVVFLVRELNVPWMWWFDLDVLWPTLLIVAGALLVWRWAKGG